MTADDAARTIREARFWAKVDKRSECWLWTGAKANGYGRASIGRVLKPAHRVAYEQLVGPIPEGLTLDHLCRNTACVNPEHLEPVTMRENILRGDGLAAINARKTHCPNGHPYGGDNLGFDQRRGRRFCRECNRQWARERMAKRRSDARAALTTDSPAAREQEGVA